MALSARQTRLYTAAADVWRGTAVTDSQGLITGETWTRIETHIPCYFEIRPNLDQPGEFGRYQADNMFVLDVLHLDITADVQSDDWIKNLTLEPDGSPSANYGHFWRVRGPARNVSNQGRRKAGKRSVYIYLEREPNADIVALDS